MRVTRSASRSLLLMLLLTPLLPGVSAAQRRGGSGRMEAERPAPLRFHYVGPQSAGRVSAIVGVPGDTLTYYIGAASGGIWKTTDGARTFTPIFDDQPVQAIGTLAVAPSDPNIVWAGTGEAWAIRDADVMGDGIYKSIDGGATWQHMGLTETGRIGRIIVHPTNPDIVYVCALGRTTGPQQERGVFRTRDGGRTWKRVLFVDPGTGCSGLAMDAHNPDILLAGTWDVVMHTWVMVTGGPGSGIYITRDGGDSWERIEDPGLPESPVGKIDVAIAPSDPDRMYALIQSGQGSLWRSDDGGESWRVVSWDRRLIGRGGYYIHLTVNPTNPDEVLVANSSFHMSVDGGLTFPIGGGGCGDCHDIWMDPLNPDHWATTGDGGAGITRNHGQDYLQVRLPIGQMYHVAVDDQVPYWVYSNRQDDGTMRGPSDSPVPVSNVPSYYRGTGVGTGVPGGGPARMPGGRGGRGSPWGGGRPSAEWEGGLGGCESGFTLPTPGNPDIIWASCYGNHVTRFDADAGVARSVSPWIHTLDSPPTDLKYRCHWTPPLAIDPFDPETVYYGCQVIFKTSNGGQSWEVISPDLSTQDPSRIVWSGGLYDDFRPGVIGDNLGQYYGEVVFAIAPSKIQQGLIWAGTNDGLIWYTDDGGENWTNVTDNVEGLPEWGTIRQITPSVFDPATAYVAVDFHLMDDRRPYIYKTTDFGRTWTKISDGLPSGHPLDYVMSVAENPNRRGMLFAGTGHGFYYSMDDGATWTQFQEGLPAAPVSWIATQKLYHDVVISTYGRGLFILRDITRLEQQDQVAAGADAFLYAPRAGIREARSGHAEFLYSLASAPREPVRFDILDSGDTVVRTLRVPSHAGLNRVSWDLLYEGPRQVELRTVPPDNPHIWEEARFLGQDTRPIVHWGIGRTMRVGPIAAPGRYTVRMTVNGETYSRPFDIVADPAIAASDADLVASTETQVRIRDLMNVTVDMINSIERMRKQIEDRLAIHTGEAAAALNALDDKMMDVELQLLSRTDLHSDDKWYVEAYRIYMQLVWLYGEVGLGAGDVAGGADHRPTDASLAWLDTLEQDIARARADFTNLVENEVPAFNRAMAGTVAPITDRAVTAAADEDA
ncbi:MAG TPA: hypothetical protein VF188_16390 [Longimicrobiales bacterium]